MRYLTVHSWCCFKPGESDLIKVAPVSASHSSPQEIKTYHSHANSNGLSYEEAPCDLADTISCVCETESSEVSDVVEFSPTYACKPSYTSVVIRNYRYMIINCTLVDTDYKIHYHFDVWLSEKISSNFH